MEDSIPKVVETKPISSSGEGTSSTPTHATATTPKNITPSKPSHALEDAKSELSTLIKTSKINSDDCHAIKEVLKEHVALKEKVDKLKSLLGRSAKAQRETKVDYEASQKRLGNAMREIERLNQRLEKLQSRPSHLDLLMDFETNFDKALLSVNQSGGQETSAVPPVPSAEEQDSQLDSMLLNELGEAKSRIEKLEELNNAMMIRSTQLESTTTSLQIERDQARQQNDRLQMEVKMAKMEAEHATRAMQDKAASLEEMQMEIDLVVKANKKANVRAAAGEEAVNSLKSDKQRVQQLEAQVQALQEWALASAEQKRLALERCQVLENKVKQLQGTAVLLPQDSAETTLFNRTGSLVVGAGDVGHLVVDLEKYAMEVDPRFVVLRWKFDLLPAEYDITMNILKGKCDTAALWKKATYLIKDRTIVGGAAGETELAFTSDHACTILWSNAKAWIRPKTVKYTIEVISLK